MTDTPGAPVASTEPLGPPAAEAHRLRGNLGVVAIVFMVLAAAAPLGVIGGPVPIAIATGNGAGFPATYIVATLVLLLFAVGFTAMTPFVPQRAPSSPMSIAVGGCAPPSAPPSSPW